jgi:hypothetical protein
MVNYVYSEEYSMECEPAMDSMWDTSENMIDDSFPETNTGFDDDASFSSRQELYSPSQSFQPCDEIENTLDSLLEMPLYDIYDSPPESSYESDAPVTGFEMIGIVTPPSSTKRTYQGQLPPAPTVVSPDVSSSTQTKRLPDASGLDEQYTQAVSRFAASMRRSEATRSEILRQRLLVHDMNEFNAGANSRSQLWSAMVSNHPVRNQC